jgi:3-oxoacyl-[acyl-carrier protein] reductase
MSTAVLGSSDVVSAAVASSLGTAVQDIDGSLPLGLGGVVIVVGSGARPTPLTSLDESEWHRLAERPMRQTLMALQRSHMSMSGRGGRIVLIVPTIGMSGAADLVPYTTALEGIRAMAKSAARQWAPNGIVVNMIAVPADLLAPAVSAATSHLTAAAVSNDLRLIETIVTTTEFLLGHEITHLVGATIVADGGSVMSP